MATATSPPPPQVVEGWYPDPGRPGQRFWDGEEWTDQFLAPTRPPGAQARTRTRLPRMRTEPARDELDSPSDV